MGVFSRFGKQKQMGKDESTPPVTPDEKGGNLDVTVVASEYDPSRPYGMGSHGISALTDRDSQSRKVAFSPAAQAALESVPSKDLLDQTANNGGATGNKSLPDAILNQTLGLFDDICQFPQANGNNVVVPTGPGVRPQWGTVPSEDEHDDSTFPSYQSSTLESHSFGNTGTLGMSDMTTLVTKDTRTSKTPAADSKAIPRTLEKSPSHDHENFEVVLDSARLERKAVAAQKKLVAAESQTAVSNKPKEEKKQRKSLVKRLFSSRKKKDVDVKSDVRAQQAAEVDQYDDDDETPLQPIVTLPSRAEEETTVAESQKEPGAIKTLAPRGIPKEAESEPVESSTQAPQNAEEIFSVVGSILSNMDCVEEEKKEEENAETAATSRGMMAIEDSKANTDESKPLDDQKADENDLSFEGLAARLGLAANSEEDPVDNTEDKPAVAAVATTEEAEEQIVKKKKKNKPLWKTAVDPRTGRTYWYNRITRESTYNPPPEAFGGTPPASPTRAAVTTAASPKQGETGPAKTAGTNTVVSNAGTSEPGKLLPKKPKPQWKAVVDKNTGRTYYYHRKTRETTWTIPEELREIEAKKAQHGMMHRGVGTEEKLKNSPPLIVQAEVTPESQERIVRGERGLLGASFEEAEPSTPVRAGASNVEDGKVDSQPLDSQPFDEPDDAPRPESPARFVGRSTTYMSGITKASNITEKTEKIKNTVKGKSLFETISENQSTTTSISSKRVDADEEYGGRIPSRVPVLRERELKVEDLTSSRVQAETFERNGRVVRGRNNNENEDGSYYGDNEVDTYGTDSVSALSENDADFSHRKENFEQARRRALDDAIEREDWDLAAALSEGMRASNSTGDYAKAHTSWNQSDLDKFIANNDWNAVKSYIARMRDAKKEGQEVAPPKASAPKRSNSFSKRIGSKSQLQHKQVLSDSSYTSDSLSDDTDDSEYS